MEQGTQITTKEHFMAGLKDSDRKHVATTVTCIRKAMVEEGRKGSIYVVGGILSKPKPRPDIDMVLILNLADDFNPKDYPTDIEMSNAQFQYYKAIIDRAFRDEPEVNVEKYAPVIDPFLQNPNILSADGRFIIKGVDATPIDISCYRYNELDKNDKRPVILLEEVT